MITDFGFARILQHSRISVCATDHDAKGGSVHWLAYELLTAKRKHKAEADVVIIDKDLSEVIGTSVPMYHKDSKTVEFELSDGGSYTRESDVWAFGMVIYVCRSFYAIFINAQYS